MKLTLLLLSLTSLTFSVRAQHGGGGRGGTTTAVTDNMDSACFAYLSAAYNWEKCASTTTNTKNSKTGNTKTTCMCGLNDVLLTTISCIDKIVGLYNSSRSEVALSTSYAALASACSLTTANVTALAKKATNLPAYQGNGNATDTWVMENPVAAFSVSEYDAKHAYIAYMNQKKISTSAQTYGQALTYYWFGLVVLRSFFYWSFNLLPSAFKLCDCKLVRLFRRYITLPATFRFRHSTAPVLFKGFTLNLPTRMGSLIVVGFCILNAVFSFADIGFYPGPNYLYQNNAVAQYSRFAAYRSGYLCMYIMPLMFLFGGRNNFMIYMTGWPLDMFNVFHKWLGRVTMFDLLVHAATYTLAYIWNGRYTTVWKQAYWNWGIAAFVIGCVMIFAGMHCFRRISYEFFLLFHILCAVWFVIGGYYHLKKQHEDLFWYWAVIAVWGFDRLVRVLRIIASNPFAKATVTSHNSTILELTVSYSKIWKTFPGSYTFVHIVQPTLFWESHPFSMMDCVEDPEKGHIKFFCRVKDGMTRRLDKLALSKGGSFETHVWLDGPYGTYMNLKPFEEFILVAGGIGIAAPFCHIQHLIAKGHANISLYWGISDSQPLEWFKREIDFMVSHNVKVFLYISNGVNEEKASLDSGDNKQSSLSSGEPKNEVTSLSSGSSSGASANNRPVHAYHRMDAYSVIKEGIIKSKGALAVLCCGPGGINDGCRKGVADNLDKTRNYVEYFEESFSW